MANHGALTLGDTLERALWRMSELETLARVLLLAEQGGTPVLLTEGEIEETRQAFQGYGLATENG